MNSSSEHIKYLWLQFVQDKASWQELQELLQYLQENHDHSYDVEVLEEYLTTHPPVIRQDDKELWAERLQQLRETRLQAPASASPRIHRRAWWLAAAAVLLLAVGIAYRANLQQPGTGVPTVIAAVGATDTLQHLQQGALLTLGDGSQVLLDSAGNGLISRQEGAELLLNDHRLTYVPRQTDGSQPATVMNRLSTPRGRQFQVELPDGSRAWLNAASSVKYPTVFREDRREVEITGEVYFEVAKKSLPQRPGKPSAAVPFIVRSPRQTIEVQGTQFNVNCYADEEAEKTTLIEGRVRIGERGAANTTNTTDAQRVLQPGEQAVLDASGGLRVQQVDIAPVTDWRTGKFLFNNDNIRTIMRKISRLYDVDVVYQDENSMVNKDFVGSVTRFPNVAELLRKLELTGTVRFAMDGKKIIVMP